MNSKEIEQRLGFLGQKLADMQIKAIILTLGGAVMVTQIGNRRSRKILISLLQQMPRPHIGQFNKRPYLSLRKRNSHPRG
ncbi:MAG TPA: hypothetical protein VGM01_12105 [Ktedonobacteraceae bacterium]|jgi:hypothetical protein